jgi:DNA-binding transcriptional ArsR family regulator
MKPVQRVGQNHKSLLDVLFPKLRQAILSAFLLQPEKWWYLSDLAKNLKVSPSSLQRELASLTDAELLESRKEGNRVYYRANLASVGVEDIQALLIKTAGVADVMGAALKSLISRSDLSFIYGSLARGEAIATSDVDLMVIGDIRLSEIAVFTKKEFLAKVKSKNAFIESVLSNKKIFLKGSESELKALVR